MKKTLSLILALTLAMALAVPAFAAIPEFTSNDLAAYRREVAAYFDASVPMERQGTQGRYGKDAWRAEGTVPCRGIDYESITNCSYSVVSMDTTWTVTNNSPAGLLLWIYLSTWETYSDRRHAEDYIEAGYLQWSGGRFANGMVDDIPVGESVTFSVADIAAALVEHKAYEDEAYELLDGDLFEIEFALYDPVTGDSIREPHRSDGRFFRLDAAAVEAVLAQEPASAPSTDTPAAATPTPAPAEKPAVILTKQNLTVDGEAKNTEIYNIDGSNYFKLRDMAALLNGTGSQFGVDFDGARNTIVVKTGEAYAPVGGELATGTDKSDSAVASAQSVEINGEKVELTAYNIGGNNFFKLRELGAALNFDVDYDDATATMIVKSK